MIVVAGAALACSWERSERGSFVTAPSYDGGVNPKNRVSLEEARRRTKFRLADLPSVPWKYACADGAGRFQLREATVLGDRVILSYSHGLWLSFSLEKGFGLTSPFGPRKRIEGEVRGRPAQVTFRGWKRDLFFCGFRWTCANSSIPTEAGGSYYEAGAELSWNENGVNVHLQGPYGHPELIEIAQNLRFDPA